MDRVFVLFLLGLAATVSAINRNECGHIKKKNADPNYAKTTNCLHAKYEGAVGAAILNNEPRQLARVVKDHGQALIENMATFIGNVPVVGSFFSTGLSLYADNLGWSVEEAINKIVDDIEAQINDLRKYVDAKIELHEVTRLSHDMRGFLRGT